MEETLDFEELRKKMKFIYSSYLKNPDNKEIKELAGALYSRYNFSGPIIKKNLSLALGNLVNIAVDTGVKLSKDKIRQILKELEEV